MATAQDHDQLPPWTFRLHHGRIWLIWRCQPISARLPLPPPSVYQYQMLGDGGSQWHNWDLQNGLWFPQTLEIAGWCHWADGNKSVYTIIAGLLGDAVNWEHLVYIVYMYCQCAEQPRAGACTQHSHANRIWHAGYHPRYTHEHMQTQTCTLPLQHNRSNLILSCASKPDISGWLQCVCAAFTHQFCGYHPDKSADRVLRYVSGRGRGHFTVRQRIYMEDVL